MKTIVPVAQLARRLPELGRLKFGDTNAKGGRRTLDNWRVVSNHRDALGDIADLYGGKVVDYSHAKSDLTAEVLTTSDVIRVGLPTYSGDDILSLNYELWTGGGCQRRCDGETATTWTKGPEGPEETEQPCLCVAAGELACDIKLRVSFFLPGVSRFGVWRLETGSWNAVAEMRGMAELLVSLRARGITEAELGLDKRHDVKAGQTRNFVVPEIRLAQSYEALAAGDGGAALGAAAGPALPAAAPTPPHPKGLNETLSERKAAKEPAIQPELVDDDDPWARHNPKARALAGRAGWDDDRWHEAVDAVTDGRSSSSKDLTEPEWADLLVVLEAEPAVDAGDFPPGWSERAGPAKASATKKARALAEEAGEPLPSSFDEIGAGLAARVVEAGA